MQFHCPEDSVANEDQMSSIISNGIATVLAGLVVVLWGSIVSARAMTRRPPKGAPKGGGLYIDFDKAGRGLFLVAAGTITQIIGTLQAAYVLLPPT